MTDQARTFRHAENKCAQFGREVDVILTCGDSATREHTDVAHGVVDGMYHARQRVDSIPRAPEQRRDTDLLARVGDSAVHQRDLRLHGAHHAQCGADAIGVALFHADADVIKYICTHVEDLGHLAASTRQRASRQYHEHNNAHHTTDESINHSVIRTSGARRNNGGDEHG